MRGVDAITKTLLSLPELGDNDKQFVSDFGKTTIVYVSLRNGRSLEGRYTGVEKMTLCDECLTSF